MRHCTVEPGHSHYGCDFGRVQLFFSTYFSSFFKKIQNTLTLSAHLYETKALVLGSNFMLRWFALRSSSTPGFRFQWWPCYIIRVTSLLPLLPKWRPPNWPSFRRPLPGPPLPFRSILLLLLISPLFAPWFVTSSMSPTWTLMIRALFIFIYFFLTLFIFTSFRLGLNHTAFASSVFFLLFAASFFFYDPFKGNSIKCGVDIYHRFSATTTITTTKNDQNYWKLGIEPSRPWRFTFFSGSLALWCSNKGRVKRQIRSQFSLSVCVCVCILGFWFWCQLEKTGFEASFPIWKRTRAASAVLRIVF